MTFRLQPINPLNEHIKPLPQEHPKKAIGQVLNLGKKKVSLVMPGVQVRGKDVKGIFVLKPYSEEV